MKKQLTIILISSVIAMILCGCNPNGNGSDSSKAESAQSSGKTQTSQSSSSENASSSDDKSEDVSSTGESSASKKEGSEKQQSGASSKKEDQSSKGKKEEASVIYDQNGDVVSTPSKYVSTTQMSVDLSDSVMAKLGEDLRLAFFTSKKELDDYYTANKDKYALDKPESGSDFKTAAKDLTDEFFESNNVMIIVQSYDKDKGIEIGDTHIEDKGAVIDIYKEAPRAPDKAAYVMNIICYSSDDISKMPEIRILAAGGMYSEESDPDVVVYLDESDPDEDAEDGPLYIIDENDNVTVVQPQDSKAG